MTKKDKAEARRRAFNRIREIWEREYRDGDSRTFVKDILTDVRHFCDRRNLDFFQLKEASYDQYLEER